MIDHKYFSGGVMEIAKMVTANHLIHVDGKGFIRCDQIIEGDIINGHKVTQIIPSKQKEAKIIGEYFKDEKGE